MNRKGFECTNMWLLDVQTSKYHVYDVRNQLQLCDCCVAISLENKGISKGVRTRCKSFRRDQDRQYYLHSRRNNVKLNLR